MDETFGFWWEIKSKKYAPFLWKYYSDFSFDQINTVFTYQKKKINTVFGYTKEKGKRKERTKKTPHKLKITILK